MTNQDPPSFLDNGPNPRIAYRREPVCGEPDHAGVVWLGGFKSTMDGAKACSLAAWARERGRACLRFDYSGHGFSGGAFGDATIGTWLAESLLAFDTLTRGRQILVGSSMGGWIALLLARAHLAAVGSASRIAGMVLIAPAVDMTERLIWAKAGPDMRRAITQDGVYLRPSAYDDGPYPITAALIEEGRGHLILGSPITAGCPVRILHGFDDPDVPWELSAELARDLLDEDVTVTYVKGGDHRLSSERDLARLGETLDSMVSAVDRAT